ncbi:MAG TPA: YfhO family protein, partial [Chloroflexia bacterium]|nr:YfhO family protein [Chloroflexia bacterium]
MPSPLADPARPPTDWSVTWRELAAALLACGLVATLFLSPALLTGRILSPADLLFSYYPWHTQPPAGWTQSSNGLLVDSVAVFEPWLIYTAARLHQGALPLWNPENMLGAPFLANMQSAIFDPLNWPYLLWPGAGTLVLRLWLRLVLAALGMYLLARQWLRAGPLGAAVAALTFALGAYVTVWLFYPLAGVAIWLPWLWGATAWLLRRPGPRPVAALAGVVALTFFGGHPETAYHLALATGLGALFLAWQATPGRPGPIARRLGLWAAAYLLGAALAAVQLLPFAEYLAQGTVLLNRSNPAWEGFWLPLRFAWTLVNPDLFGNPAHHDWWAANNNYNETNSYSGIVPLLLAPLALAVRDRAQRRIAVFLLGLLLLAAAVVYHVPGIYQAATLLPLLRNAANHRLLLVVEFALGLLAALGVEALTQQFQAAPAPARRQLVAGVIAWTGLVGLLGVGLPQLIPGFFELPAGVPFAVQAWQTSFWRTTGLLLGAGVLLIALAGRGPRRPRLARGALILLPLLVLADLWQVRGDYNPAIAPTDYFPPTAATRFLQQQPGLFRSIGLLQPNFNLPYGLALLPGNDAVTPRLYDELTNYIDPLIPRNNRRHYNPVDPLPSRIWNLLGVRYVLASPGVDPNYLLDVHQDLSSGETLGEIRGPRQVGQTFVATHDNLAEVDVLGATYGGRATGKLIFHLKASPADRADLVTKALDMTRLPDNAPWAIRFPPVRRAGGRTFYFYLAAPDAAPEQGVTLWFDRSDVYTGGSRMESGQAAAGDLVFQTRSLFDPSGPWLGRVLDGGPTGASIFENRKMLPRAWLVHTVAVEPDTTRRLQQIYDPALDWRRTAVLDAPLPPAQALAAAGPASVAPIASATEAVTITRYAPEQVTIAARSPVPGLLILADQAFPGWEARVDGQPAPIVTADQALRGVYLPAGAHEVQFDYRPLSFAWGLGISLSVLLLIVLLGAW